MSRIKSIQYILIILGFAGILSAGMLFQLQDSYNIPLFSTPVSSSKLALFLITLSVVFYFLGRVMGFVLKYQRNKGEL